jgi:hypothetical protein
MMAPLQARIAELEQQLGDRTSSITADYTSH